MMAGEGILGAFGSHAFLNSLDERSRMALAAGVRPFTAQPGEYLGREGAAAKAFYLVQSGHVTLETTPPGREPVQIQTLGAGDVVGWSWLVPPHRWKFDCRARDEVRGIAFDAEWLRERCEQNHELGYHLLRQLVAVMASRLAATRLHTLGTRP